MSTDKRVFLQSTMQKPLFILCIIALLVASITVYRWTSNDRAYSIISTAGHKPADYQSDHEDRYFKVKYSDSSVVMRLGNPFPRKGILDEAKTFDHATAHFAGMIWLTQRPERKVVAIHPFQGRKMEIPFPESQGVEDFVLLEAALISAVSDRWIILYIPGGNGQWRFIVYDDLAKEWKRIPFEHIPFKRERHWGEIIDNKYYTAFTDYMDPSTDGIVSIDLVDGDADIVSMHSTDNPDRDTSNAPVQYHAVYRTGAKQISFRRASNRGGEYITFHADTQSWADTPSAQIQEIKDGIRLVHAKEIKTGKPGEPVCDKDDIRMIGKLRVEGFKNSNRKQLYFDPDWQGQNRDLIDMWAYSYRYNAINCRQGIWITFTQSLTGCFRYLWFISNDDLSTNLQPFVDERA